MSNELSLSEVHELLKPEGRERTTTTWFDTFKDHINQAIRREDATVYLAGELFRIKYLSDRRVMIRPDKGFVPMGYFRRDDPDGA